MGKILEDKFRNTFSSYVRVIIFRVYHFYHACPVGDLLLKL